MRWAPRSSHDSRPRRPGSSTSGTSSTPSTCGASPAGQAAACCCASRTTIGSAAGRSTSGPSSRIWTGSALPPTTDRSVKASAARSMRRRSSTSAVEVSCTHANARAVKSPRRASPAQELRYPGTCRDKGLPERPGLGVRARLAPSVERFHDLRHGPQEQRPFEETGDVLLRDRDGHWSYQFAVTVDDQAQQITMVIRGDDLLASTGRQIQLARLLGRATPPAISPSSAADEIGDAEAEQSRSRHQRARPSRRRLDGRRDHRPGGCERGFDGVGTPAARRRVARLFPPRHVVRTFRAA